jgi:hypothetical protein
LGERGCFRSGKIGKVIAMEATVGVDEMYIDVKAADEVAEAAEEAPDIGAVLRVGKEGATGEGVEEGLGVRADSKTMKAREVSGTQSREELAEPMLESNRFSMEGGGKSTRREEGRLEEAGATKEEGSAARAASRRVDRAVEPQLVRSRRERAKRVEGGLPTSRGRERDYFGG